MATIKELREQRAAAEKKVADHLRAAEGRQMTAEEAATFDNLEKDFNTIDQQVQAEEKREAWNKREVLEKKEPETRSDDKEMEQRIFRKTLRSGRYEPDYTPEERAYIAKRAAITGIKTDEHFVPTDMERMVEIALKTTAGMMGAGSIINTATGAELLLPTISDVTAKSTIINELEAVKAEKKTFGTIAMKAFTYATPIIPISYEAIQDAVFDMESVIARLLGESHGRAVNEHLTVGTGTDQPLGILTAAPVGASAAAADAITFDDLIDLMASVDPAYGNEGRWMLNQNTLYALMKIKDNNGQYIWQPATTAGQPAMIWGKSYVTNTDMPNIGSGNASVLFGALSKYQIRIVRNFSLQVLREVYAANRAIGILGFARMDGRLVDAGTGPVKKLVHA